MGRLIRYTVRSFVDWLDCSLLWSRDDTRLIPSVSMNYFHSISVEINDSRAVVPSCRVSQRRPVVDASTGLQSSREESVNGGTGRRVECYMSSSWLDADTA